MQGVREMLGGDFSGFTGQHVFFAHDQQLRVFLAVDAIPAVEGRGLMNFSGQARVVKRVQGFFVGQNIAAPGLGLQLVELFQQLGIGRQALGPRLDFAPHQAFADKQLARHHRVNRPVMNGTATDHNQAEQGDLLKGHHLSALLLPVRLEVVLFDQVPGQRLDPVRLDLGHHPRIELGGLDQFGGHQPLRAFFTQAGGRMNPEPALTCAQVVTLFSLLPDLAEQAGQHRFMQLGVVGRFFIDRQLHVATDQTQLAV